MTLGALITSTEIAQDKPVTARLFRKLRGNLRGLTTLQWRNAGLLSGSSTTVFPTFTTVWSFELFVPDCCIGESGTRLTLADVGISAPSDNQNSKLLHYRVQVGAALSAQFNHFSTFATTHDFVVEWIPTGNTVVLVELQACVRNAANRADGAWARGALGLLEQINP